MAELYIAIADVRANRLDRARAIADGLLRRERDVPGHLAIVAHAQYLRALCDGMNARWGDAIRGATESRDAFACLGETGLRGHGDMVLGDALGFLGQPQLALRHLMSAASAASKAGEWDRLQVCAATMNMIELRRHRWNSANALSRVELSIGADSELTTHAYLRQASGEAWSGRPADALAALRRARETSSGIPDPAMRDKLLSDVAAVEGRVLTASNPALAIARLTDSLEFQQRTGRSFAIPWIYLDRGRARLRIGENVRALADFEAGIRSLESQRTTIPQDALRAGVLDDTRALFTEAAAVALRAGDADRAFAYIERGRARSLLDELADTATNAEIVTVRDLQGILQPGTLLVSYAALSDRLAIFVIDRDGVRVRFSDVKPDALAAESSSLLAAIDQRKGVSAAASRLYGALIAPIEKDAAGAAKLIVIPDPAIEQVPFAALWNRSTRKYLIETLVLSMAPSASVFFACSRRAGASNERSLAIFANPATAAPVAFLRAADTEAVSIASLYPRSLVRRRDAATTERFIHESRVYGIVQFSGHARIDRAEPRRSALLLDRELSTREISHLRFPGTTLVIVAGCSTLAGDADRVESTASIGRAFLAARVPAVIGSLWDVDDSDAARMMKRLHKLLSRGMAPAAALHSVQCDLIRERGGDRADLWAAFAVVGADRPEP